MQLKEYAGNPKHWEVKQGSILDSQFLHILEPADIVYSWGVLHHTGEMWTAMDNTIKLMKDNARLYIALYDYDIQINPPAEFWLGIKQRYNQSNWFQKRWLELWYIWRFMLRKNVLFFPILIKRVIGYKRSRGMAFYIDIKDWLGGWPMEFAKRDDITRWAQENDLEIINSMMGEANSEWLFRRGIG